MGKNEKQEAEPGRSLERRRQKIVPHSRAAAPAAPLSPPPAPQTHTTPVKAEKHQEEENNRLAPPVGALCALH